MERKRGNFTEYAIERRWLTGKKLNFRGLHVYHFSRLIQSQPLTGRGLKRKGNDMQVGGGKVRSDGFPLLSRPVYPFGADKPISHRFRLPANHKPRISSQRRPSLPNPSLCCPFWSGRLENRNAIQIVHPVELVVVRYKRRCNTGGDRRDLNRA